MKKLYRVLVIVMAVMMMFSGTAINVRALDTDEENTPQESTIIEVVVPAVWIPVDKNTNEVLSYLNPISTIPDMYPRSEVAKLDDDDQYMIDYMGVPKPDPGAWFVYHFMYTANLFFTDRFHRVVAQGRDERNFDEEISAVRKLEYGALTDEAAFNSGSGKYTGLHGMTKTEYQPDEVMNLYIATETEDTSLSNAIFEEEFLGIIYNYDDAVMLKDLYNNIKQVKFNDFDNWAQITTLDGINDQEGLRQRLDTIYLFKYDSPNSDSGSFITEGASYKDFVANGFAGLEPGKYEVVLPIYWNRNVPDYMSAPDVFSRNRYQYDDTIHYTVNIKLPRPELEISNYLGVYDGEAHSIELTTGTIGDTVKYSIDGGTTWLTEKPSFANIGTYEVAVKVTNPNYEDRAGSGTVKITPKAARIIVDDKEKWYGEEDPEFTYTIDGLIEGDDVQITKLKRQGDGYNTSPEEEPGYYKGRIVATYSTAPPASNYNIKVRTGHFTIKQDPLVTGTEVVYDGEGHSITVNNLIDGDWVEYSIDGGTTWGWRQPWYRNVGEHTVKVRVTNDYLDPNTESDNFYFNRENQAVVKITPKAATITVENSEKVYGESDPAFVGTVEGLINEEDLGDVTYSRENDTEVAGTYKDVLVAEYTANRNYEITESRGTFIIRKTGDVTVTYQDTEGNELEKLILNGKSGREWTSEQKEFDGYNFKEVIGNTDGTFTEAAQAVTYVYTPEPILPSLTLEKLVEESSFSQVGDELNYSFAITNTSELPLVKLTVNDPKLDIVDLEIDLTLTPLAFGETYTHVFSAPYIVTEADVAANGPITNVLTVIAETEAGSTAEFEADVTVPFEQVAPFMPPILTLEKLVKEDSFSQVGDELHYSFTVKNEGIMPVVKLTVNDPKLGIEDLIIDLTDDPIMPGETYTHTFNQAYVISAADVEAGKVDNELTVIGETPEGATIELTDSVTVPMERVLPHIPKTGEHHYYHTSLIALVLGGAFVIMLIKRRQQLKQD